VISPTQQTLPDSTQHSQQTDIHVPGRIRTRNPRKREAADRAASGISPILLENLMPALFNYASTECLPELPICGSNIPNPKYFNLQKINRRLKYGNLKSLLNTDSLKPTPPWKVNYKDSFEKCILAVVYGM